MGFDNHEKKTASHGVCEKVFEVFQGLSRLSSCQFAVQPGKLLKPPSPTSVQFSVLMRLKEVMSPDFGGLVLTLVVLGTAPVSSYVSYTSFMRL